MIVHTHGVFIHPKHPLRRSRKLCLSRTCVVVVGFIYNIYTLQCRTQPDGNTRCRRALFIANLNIFRPLLIRAPPIHHTHYITHIPAAYWYNDTHNPSSFVSAIHADHRRSTLISWTERCITVYYIFTAYNIYDMLYIHVHTDILCTDTHIQGSFCESRAVHCTTYI